MTILSTWIFDSFRAVDVEELKKFSTLTSYNCEAREFWAKQKYTYPFIFRVVLIPLIRIKKLFALSLGIHLIFVQAYSRKKTWFSEKVSDNSACLPKNSHQNSSMSTALNHRKPKYSVLPLTVYYKHFLLYDLM